jgi:hypothetical protein
VIEDKKREEDNEIIKNFKKIEYQSYLMNKKVINMMKIAGKRKKS